MVDLHSHLIPGVDDGAASIQECRNALREMSGAGVTALVTTPHLDASLTLKSDEFAAYLSIIDAAWSKLEDLVVTEFHGLTVRRGAEILLDTPHPNLSDRRIHLANTDYVLVEFPFSGLPPNSEKVLFDLRMSGINPVVAHPERYQQVCFDLAYVEQWRRVGAKIQVNSGSFVGAYGRRAKAAAFALLKRGWIDYLSSDFHARGQCYSSQGAGSIRTRRGQEAADLLTVLNPRRVLENREPLPLGEDRKRGWFNNVFGPKPR